MTGSQGNQGNQGNQGIQGSQLNYYVQGAQYNIPTSLTNIPGLTTGTLAAGSQYDVEAIINAYVSAGSQGIQWAVASSGTSPTVRGLLIGTQGTQAGTSTSMEMQQLTASGAQGYQTCCASGAQGALLIRARINVGTGSPVISIQGKSNQSGAYGWVQANSYMKVNPA